MVDYYSQIEEIINAGLVSLSSISPSDWAEKTIVMPAPYPGPLRYEKTPYTREIIDRFAPNDPAREIAVMGAAQFGKTASIIIPVIGYIIANEPGNIIMTVGHEDLLTEAMDKVDAMLDTSDLRKMIKSSAKRAKSQKTGDTNTMKQFANGFLKVSAASNPKIWQQSSYKYGLIDDYERVKGGTKQAGNTRDLIEKRFTAYSKTKKILYVSSPELEKSSNILEVYKMGDQRKYLIPCPCCGCFIELKWSTDGKKTEKAGITWQLDSDNKPIRDSIGYICQECGDFFTDQYKSTWVNKGYWQPTAIPVRPDFFSYHMSSLYSPAGMSDWTHYVYKFLECNPIGGVRNERKYQTFLNLDLGEPYVEIAESPAANVIQGNIRNYEIATIPEKLSLADGNGNIVLLTIASDMNGVVDDARLDYEVVAWSESGASYSVTHGSIGTFVPREGQKKHIEDREKLSYDIGKPNNVWTILDKIMAQKWHVDTDRVMTIFACGLDTGHYTLQAYSYIDKTNYNVYGLKGKDADKYIKQGIDLPSFRHARERNGLFLVEVMQIKDRLSELMRLRWDSGYDDIQPPGFMNFPIPSDGLYLYKNFFSHYEAEQRIIETNAAGEVTVLWKKKDSVVQNHFWDVRVYNMVMKDIIVYLIGKDLKQQNYTWSDFCAYIKRFI